MKRHIYTIILIAFLDGLSPSPLIPQANAQVSISFQVFYDRLSPYGSWVSYPSYGYVWVPTSVPYGFRPYGSGGHWVFTEEGWTWISNYQWGWAPFHYGNWFYDDSYGWMWAPGYDWAPAWVTWGEYSNQYCWAPIGPGINISVGNYRPPAYYWNFVPREHITSVNINNYYIRNESRTTIVNNITVINNVNRQNGSGHAAYVRGPEPQNVQKYTHSTITPLTIRPSSRPGGGSVQQGQVAIYRPTVDRNPSGANKPPAPARVQDLRALRPASLPANAHAQPINSSNNSRQPAIRPGESPAARNQSGSSTDYHRQNNSSRLQARPVASQTNPSSNIQANTRNHSSGQQNSSQPRTQNRFQSLPQNHPSNNQSNPRTDARNPMQVQQQRSQSRPLSTPAARSYRDQNYSRPNAVRQQPIEQPRPQQRQQAVPMSRPAPVPAGNHPSAPPPRQDEHHR